MTISIVVKCSTFLIKMYVIYLKGNILNILNLDRVGTLVIIMYTYTNIIITMDPCLNLIGLFNYKGMYCICKIIVKCLFQNDITLNIL